MNDQQVGRAFRALRIRRGFRQVDVARRANVDEDAVGLLDRGELEHLSLPMLRRLWSVLGITVEIHPRLSPAERANLFDAAHAALVERAAQTYRAEGWETVVEYTFNDFGERGSVDLLCWRARDRALAINEVKSRIPDIQDLHASLDRKARIVPSLVAKERAWLPERLGRVLIVADTNANRHVVSGHHATFASSFPARGRAARAWVHLPIGNLAAIWFLPYPDGARSYEGRSRVRPPKRP